MNLDQLNEAFAPVVCSFCGKDDKAVKHLITSEDKLHAICDECVERSRDLIGANRFHQAAMAGKENALPN